MFNLTEFFDLTVLLTEIDLCNFSVILFSSHMSLANGAVMSVSVCVAGAV